MKIRFSDFGEPSPGSAFVVKIRTPVGEVVRESDGSAIEVEVAQVLGITIRERFCGVPAPPRDPALAAARAANRGGGQPSLRRTSL